ncbi:MAG: hypothetical protein FJ388_10310, partial [Verrucomicrobia bacterium]|nr:hypothetical protein [Verrucomicrobiota bacterium]
TSDSFIVHGLDTDAKNVAAARQHIQSLGLYGKVSVEQWSGERLPYADNLVNLVVTSGECRVARDEIMRVLAPNGVALSANPKSKIQNPKLQKPWPADIDEWTHYLHDASGNAVASDSRVGPPRSLQWLAGPWWPRSHEYTPSISAMVSAGGRVFYIMDEGIRGIYEPPLPERWALYARDGFNGVRLWKRPFSGWGPAEWENSKHWSTPMSLPRRLVAAGDRLYVTLGYRAPVTVLDARTGETIRVCRDTENTEEIVWSDGVLLSRRRKGVPNYPRGASAWNVQLRRPETKQAKEFSVLPPASAGDETIVALNADTGEALWKWSDKRIVTLSLAALSGRVCYHNLDEIVCLDLRTGRQLWRTPCKVWPDLTGTAGTLVMYRDVVLHAGDQGLEAFAAATGKRLWKGSRSLSVAPRNPADVLVADGLVWGSMTAEMAGRTATARILLPTVASPNPAPAMTGMVAQGFDPLTGEVKRRIDIAHLVSPGHHVRCYRSKATDRFLLWPKRGIEFVDLDGGKQNMRCDWTRGECSYGVMPCNGLVYVPPHPCLCYVGVALNGFNAMTAKGVTSDEWRVASGGERLERGPAYDAAIQNPKSKIQNPDDWPTYRSDAARSGSTKSAVSEKLKTLWSVDVGGKLSAPVIAGGKVFFASVDAHTVCALDAADGRTLWRFTAGGRVDSPPTIHEGRGLFGSHDGWVYCLSAADGALAWRFRAAPDERRIVSWEQVESAWPVPGSVLVQNGVAYFVAGRSSFLDGGLYLYALEPRTGKLLHRGRLDGPWPDVSKDAGRPYDMDGAKSDILSSDGNSVFLIQNEFDLQLKRREPQPLPDPDPNKFGWGPRQVARHLMPTSGFLDDTWHDRMFWTYGRMWPGRNYGTTAAKSGQILVFDETTTYALKPFDQPGGMSPKFVPGDKGYSLIADANDAEPVKRFTRTKPPKWSVKVPVRARAMVLAGRTLFLAGAPDALPAGDPYAALEGRHGALLRTIATADGTTLDELKLPAPPIFDGMAAAHGRLYVATEDGKMLCLTERR